MLYLWLSICSRSCHASQNETIRFALLHRFLTSLTCVCPESLTVMSCQHFICSPNKFICAVPENPSLVMLHRTKTLKILSLVLCSVPQRTCSISCTFSSVSSSVHRLAEMVHHSDDAHKLFRPRPAQDIFRNFEQEYTYKLEIFFSNPGTYSPL